MIKKKIHLFWNWEYSSEVEYLPSTHEALGPISSKTKQNNLPYPRKNYFIIINKNICIFCSSTAINPTSKTFPDKTCAEHTPVERYTILHLPKLLAKISSWILPMYKSTFKRG